MNIDLNHQEVTQFLSGLDSSVDSISNAANYFLEHGTDINVCSILCGEWYNQFYMQKNIQNGEKYMFLLMYVAQDVLKKCNLKSEQQSKVMNEQFKIYLGKALAIIPEVSSLFKKQLLDLLDQWASHKLLELEFIDNLKKNIDPKALSSQTTQQSNYPPPVYLINFSKNNKELNVRKQKVSDYSDNLTKLHLQLQKKEPGNDEKKLLWENIVEGLQKSLESEQKYRQMLLKDSAEMLKDIDRHHFKGISALKHLHSRLDELKKIKSKRSIDKETAKTKTE